MACCCSLKLQSDAAEVIQKAKLCVWDEATMANKHVFNAVDRSLRDIMKGVDRWREHLPFGSKVMVFGGDFRQVTPVLRRGSRAQVAALCMKNCDFWKHAVKMHLTINMRVAGLSGIAAQVQKAFSSFLLSIGNGDHPTAEVDGKELIRLPDDMCMPTEDLEDLVQHVYGDTELLLKKHHIMQRAILTPKNDTAHEINDVVMRQLPGEVSNNACLQFACVS